MIALTWGDVDLGRHRIHVRRRVRNGRIGPPKSAYGRRGVPLTPTLARDLWAGRKAAKRAADADLMWPSATGGHLDVRNLHRDVLGPAREAAGVEWAGFHTLRHMCGTILFRRGLNAKQVQLWLGHHSPAFTLATYVHLLPEDVRLVDVLAQGGNQAGRDQPRPGEIPPRWSRPKRRSRAECQPGRDQPRSRAPSHNPFVAGSNPAAPIA